MYTYAETGIHLYGEKLIMYSYSKYEAQERYDNWNTVQVKHKLNQKTDADFLKWIAQQKNSKDSSVQGAIKALIREDIARHGEQV